MLMTVFLLDINEYRLFRRDRGHKVGGGVCLYVKFHLWAQEVATTLTYSGSEYSSATLDMASLWDAFTVHLPLESTTATTELAQTEYYPGRCRGGRDCVAW